MFLREFIILNFVEVACDDGGKVGGITTTTTKNSGWYIANLNKHISGFLVVAPPGMICCRMQKEQGRGERLNVKIINIHFMSLICNFLEQNQQGTDDTNV